MGGNGDSQFWRVFFWRFCSLFDSVSVCLELLSRDMMIVEKMQKGKVNQNILPNGVFFNGDESYGNLVAPVKKSPKQQIQLYSGIFYCSTLAIQTRSL